MLITTRHQVMRAVRELGGCRQVLVISADQASQVKPAELDAEQELEQRCEEECGQRETCQRNDRDRIVCLRILFGCSDNAERDRDEDLKDERNTAHGKGDPYRILKLLCYGNRPSPAVAEVAAQGSACPGEKSGDDPLVHSVCGAELFHPLFKALGSRLHGLLSRDLFQIGSREAAHQHINDKRDKDQYKYGDDQSLYNIFFHVYTSGYYLHIEGSCQLDTDHKAAPYSSADHRVVITAP